MPEQPERKVGVYERPARADRPRLIKKLVWVVAIVFALLWALYFFAFRT